MSKPLPRIAITSGEPAGIGPDLCVRLASQGIPAHLTLIGDAEMLAQRAHLLGVPWKATDYQAHPASAPKVDVIHIPTTHKVTPGKLDAANSQYVLNTLTCAMDGCLSGAFDAMVTAPVHKGVINDAAIAFTGHTEFLAEYTHTEQVVMMLVGGGMRVALATTHLPLAKVPEAITPSHLETTLRILHADLVSKFGISHPRILVAGLNPHAGESGYLGQEEILVINPVLDKLRAEGMHLVGTLPADTMFSPKNVAQADAFLCMYHDQGLPVLKHASFGSGVNITLGLPIIRTSVDHGTALDLAGTGNIEIGSILAAIQLAATLATKPLKDQTHVQKIAQSTKLYPRKTATIVALDGKQTVK